MVTSGGLRKMFCRMFSQVTFEFMSHRELNDVLYNYLTEGITIGAQFFKIRVCHPVTSPQIHQDENRSQSREE